MVRFTFVEEEQNIETEDEILWENWQSWKEFLGLLALGFVLLFFYGVGLIVLFYVLVERYSRLYFITSYRAVCRVGILSRDVSEIDIIDVRDISIHQTLWQRMLRIGDVELSSAGRPGVEVTFTGVKYPQEVVEIVRRRKREIRRELHRESTFPDTETDE